MKKSEYYKIVSKTPQGRMSMVVNNLPDFLRVQYKVHRWVKAPIGGLLVFADYEAAEDCYYKSYGTNELWRVLVKEPVSLPLWRFGFFAYIHYKSHVIQLWNGTNIGTCNWPCETAAFKYVRLEERIK